MQSELDREKVLQILRQELTFLRARFGVARLVLYGSFAKGTARPRSDVDLLVALSRPLGFEFVDLSDHLEKVLGRRVHLVTFDTFERSRQLKRYRALAIDVQRTMIDVRP